MKRVVFRERNKTYYRVLHLPLWIWVFFILPGPLTHDLYVHGPDRRHWIWLAIVTAVCVWRGAKGRLPGVEPKPYIMHWGSEAGNLPYRVVCYTAAWIDLFAPFLVNLLGLLIAVFTGRWLMAELYRSAYWIIASVIGFGTMIGWTPRARRSVRGEGWERGWFYVMVWTVVPTQLASWAMWRLAGHLGWYGEGLNRARLAVFVAIALAFGALGVLGRLPRTERYASGAAASAAAD